MLAKNVTENDKIISMFHKSSLPSLMEAIDEYYNKAFSPEIVNALKITDKSDVVAKLICKYAEVGKNAGNTMEFTEKRLQMNLYYIAETFSKCLGTLKLSKNITLYIDGIDIRPSQIPYSEYLDCIKGLSAACWTLNTEVFANTRDSSGHFKIVLLLRPDIFNSLNLQNATNKLADNSVFLEWRTTYVDYPTSTLFQMANKLLNYNQPDIASCNWNQYFDFFSTYQFSYSEYLDSYNKYINYILDTATEIPKFVEEPRAFLQMLYDSNVIAAIEGDGEFFHFSYREKSSTNISPDVPYNENISYRFHYGLYKKGNFGRF